MISPALKFCFRSKLSSGVRALSPFNFFLNTSESFCLAGQEKFNAQELKSWHAGDSKDAAGEVKNFGGLTYMTLYGAGHMVPMDKPGWSLFSKMSYVELTDVYAAESLHMVQRWLENKSM